MRTDAEERAKYIVNLFYGVNLADPTKSYYDQILVQISEAEREAVEADRKIWDEQHAIDLKLHSEQAWTAAREKAIVIVENHIESCVYKEKPVCCGIIQEDIESMEPDK